MASLVTKNLSVLTCMVLLLAVLAKGQPNKGSSLPPSPPSTSASPPTYTPTPTISSPPVSTTPSPPTSTPTLPSTPTPSPPTLSPPLVSTPPKKGPKPDEGNPKAPKPDEGKPNPKPGKGPKPKQVKCQDKRYPQCYHLKLLCPDACPRTCSVDCASCQPVCGPLLPPSTPPPVLTPHPPPPTYTPPPTPVVTPPSPPTSIPPPVSTPPPSPPTSSPPQSPSTLTPPPVSTPPSPPPLTPPQSPPTLTPPPVSTPPSPPTSTSPQSPPTLTPPPVSTPPSPPTSSPPRSPPTLTPPTYNPPPTSNPPPASTPPSPPDASEVSGKRVYCKNRFYPQCYRMEQRCPSACPDQCEVDCVTCSPVCNCNRPGAVCQDPRFVGADGIAFYFHGKKDKDFCMVSDSNLHINAHFIGRRNENMKRDFTWVQSLGILFNNNQIFIGAKKTATWKNAGDRLALAFNGESVSLSEGEGAKWEPTSVPGVSITRSRNTNAAVIEVEGNFQIKATVVPITEKESRIHKYGITDEDCFAHLDLSFKFYSLTGVVNGVLGQTYASNYVSRVKMGVKMPVLGGDKEFSSSNLFSTDCEVARFSGTDLNSSSENVQFANLNCVSGFNGRGVVCKR